MKGRDAMGDRAARLVPSFFMAVGVRLGRCVYCMRWSGALALSFALLSGLMVLVGAARGLVAMSALPALAFTAWTGAHGLAYALRGPERAAGCDSCAERARQRERKARRQRLLAWLPGRQPARAAARRGSACIACGKSTPVESMGDSPPAEAGLRHVVERSPEFQSLGPRLIGSEPSDTWTADLLHYFLYELQPDAEGRRPHAVFIARWEDDVPVSAVIVTPDPGGSAPRSIDLRSLHLAPKTIA